MGHEKCLVVVWVWSGRLDVAEPESSENISIIIIIIEKAGASGKRQLWLS